MELWNRWMPLFFKHLKLSKLSVIWHLESISGKCYYKCETMKLMNLLRQFQFILEYISILICHMWDLLFCLAVNYLKWNSYFLDSLWWTWRHWIWIGQIFVFKRLQKISFEFKKGNFIRISKALHKVLYSVCNDPQIWVILTIQCRKTYVQILHGFWHKIYDVAGLSAWILIKSRFLGTLLVVECDKKFHLQNFLNFINKIGSKVEICWKSDEFKSKFSKF